MATVFPFRGVRYTCASGTALSEVIAPPYDVISPEELKDLAARSPFNVVHLILGERGKPDESRYAGAARAFQDWLAKGVLEPDPRPSLYLLEESFLGPAGRRLVRHGVLAAVRLHDFRDGVIVPHEKTLAAPRADRLELVKAVKANLSPILGLYQDEQNEVLSLFAGTMPYEPTAEAHSDDGVHHRMWRVESPPLIWAFRRLLAERRIVIADGHHRYETALLYRDLVDATTPGLPENAGHRHCLMFLCSSSDPGLVIFPTHRLLFGLPDLSVKRLLDLLAPSMEVETLEEDLHRPAGRAWAVSRLAEHAGKSCAFLMVTAEDQKARILRLRDEADLSAAKLPKSETLRSLDVNVLHGLVLEHVLGLSPRSQENEENVRYLRDAGEAVARTLSGEFQIGFLVNPTPLWQLQAVAEAGETMPPKTTFFYPKLATGLVMRQIDPAERLVGPG